MVPAMGLLALAVAGDDPFRYLWVCLAYAGFLAALDLVLRARPSLRPLSSMVRIAIAVCLALAAICLGVRAHLIEERLEQFLPPLLRRLRPAARTDPVTYGL